MEVLLTDPGGFRGTLAWGMKNGQVEGLPSFLAPVLGGGLLLRE